MRRFFESYATDNLTLLRTEVLAPDAAWCVPGRHPLAGCHRGVDDIVSFYRRLALADLRNEPLYLTADDQRVVEVCRSWSDRSGGLDTTWVTVYRIDDGRIVQAQHFVSDHGHADEFFCDIYAAAPAMTD
ncbi:MULTISPECIES: nuclear transport factor 2 family protein [unclassified Streptomyces]|uniref:nuclear transport factor 2 family protein n=1 Tax=unclassified Streptomyces TaxID=2593676 RepID=UPI0037FDD7EE